MPRRFKSKVKKHRKANTVEKYAMMKVNEVSLHDKLKIDKTGMVEKQIEHFSAMAGVLIDLGLIEIVEHEGGKEGIQFTKFAKEYLSWPEWKQYEYAKSKNVYNLDLTNEPLMELYYNLQKLQDVVGGYKLSKKGQKLVEKRGEEK